MPQTQTPTPEQELAMLQVVLDFLRGEDPDLVRLRLQILSKNARLSARAICERISLSHIQPVRPLSPSSDDNPDRRPHRHDTTQHRTRNREERAVPSPREASEDSNAPREQSSQSRSRTRPLTSYSAAQRSPSSSEGEVVDHARSRSRQSTRRRRRRQERTRQYSHTERNIPPLHAANVPLTEQALVQSRKRYINAIFTAIDKGEESDYQTIKLQRATNLYGLLYELKDDSLRAKNIQKIIKQVEPPTPWITISALTTLFVAALGTLGYFYRTYLETFALWVQAVSPSVATWLATVFSLFQTFPILFMAKDIIVLAWHWGWILSDDTISTKDKTHDLLFITLGGVMNITACALWFYTAGIMTLPTIILFVLSAAVSVLESVASLYRYSMPVEPEADAPWYKHASYQEQLNQHQYHQAVFTTKLVAALFITAAVILMYTLPPSIILTASAVVFIWGVALTRLAIVSAVREHYDYALQKNTETIQAEQPSEMLPTGPQAMPLYSRVSHLQLMCNQQQVRINELELENRRLRSNSRETSRSTLNGTNSRSPLRQFSTFSGENQSSIGLNLSETAHSTHDSDASYSLSSNHT